MLALLRWLSGWPLSVLHGLGGPLGWLTFVLSPAYRRRFVGNARQAGLEPARFRPAIAEAGRLLMELPPLWLRPAAEPIRSPVRWEGGELVGQAMAGGRGIVFLTPHLGCFEVAAQSYAERYGPEFGPVTVLFRPARKAWLRPIVSRTRARPCLETAPATLAGVRQMLRALRRGEAVGLLPDQVPPEGLGVWAPFFGRPAYTMTLAARLVQQTGAVPLAIWAERLARGAGYIVRVSPLAESLPREASAQAESAAVVNRAMERLILEKPEQYLWGYHRYKAPSRPAPEADG